MTWQRVLCVIIGYVFGLFQTGFIIGKIHKIDIRDYGSGNSGTTNAMRTMGKKSGIITYLGDALKAVLAIGLTYLLFRSTCQGHMFTLALYAGFGVVLGHNFPFYMDFKGGKGIAASSGVILALSFYDWKYAVMAACIFFITLAITKYVSMGSLMMMTGFFVETVVWGQLEMIRHLHPDEKIEVYVLVGLMTILSFIRHKENIKRLLNGTENKVGQKKTTKK